MKNHTKLKRFIMLTVFVINLLSLFGITEASHALNIEVDRPNGYYISGKDTITFTVTNNGNDDAYVACDYPMQAYTNPQGGQPNGVAQDWLYSDKLNVRLPELTASVSYNNQTPIKLNLSQIY